MSTFADILVVGQFEIDPLPAFCKPCVIATKAVTVAASSLYRSEALEALVFSAVQARSIAESNRVITCRANF
jgi:hypothetical protein